MNKFSKMKVHWWTYNHCLFVTYLSNVAFGYRCISDTKFQTFSAKDWIWICKKFSDMDQELKNQYPLTSIGEARLCSHFDAILNKVGCLPW